MMLRIGKAHEQAPPIVDQRHTARQQPAAFEIMRGEAAPTPLVLQLVERVLAVCPIAVQLTERQDLAVERGHQRSVFRTGLDWTHKYPPIAAAVASLGARQAYLDGELCGRLSRPHHLVRHDPGRV